MAVQPIWSVDTLQINVNQGDSALHVLQRSDGPGKPAYVEKLVLIDGGTEYKAYQLQDLLYNLGSLGYKGHPDDLDLGFLTSIVVTHVCTFSSTSFPYFGSVREYSDISGVLKSQNEVLEYSRASRILKTSRLCNADSRNL